MIRNRLEEGEIRFTELIVHPLIVSLGPKEQEIYKRGTEFIKARGRRTGLGNMLPLITLQRDVCSTFLATALSLENMLVGLSQVELAVSAALLKYLAVV